MTSPPYVTTASTLTTQQLPPECDHRDRIVITTSEDIDNRIDVYLCAGCDAGPFTEEWKP